MTTSTISRRWRDTSDGIRRNKSLDMNQRKSGAPRESTGELLKLGINVAERTVSPVAPAAAFPSVSDLAHVSHQPRLPWPLSG
jgi:hypothetical protein